MKAYKIPVGNKANQSLLISLSFDNGEVLNLQLELCYNEIAKYWQMTIKDAITKDVILYNVPLLTGEDILRQYKYKNIGFSMVYKSSNIELDYPNDETLGQDFILLWGEE